MYLKRQSVECRGGGKGLSEGLSKGLSKGLSEGLIKGLSEGLIKGLSEGLIKGLSKGLCQVKAADKIVLCSFYKLKCSMNATFSK